MDNYMKYKGFHGSVEYSQQDNILHGKVIGVRDLVSYEGSSIQELSDDFHGAVNNYIESLKADGISVNPPAYKEDEQCACTARR